MKKILAGLCAVSLSLMGCTDNGILLKSNGKNYVSLDPNGVYKIGTPYQVNNIWYYPQEDYAYKEVGIASWYGPDFHNGMTANGEKYDMHALTAAHRTLPLPSIVKVTNLENGKMVVVRVNDRGPFVNNRIIDVSKAAAEILGMTEQGTAKVRVEILQKESKQLKKEILNNGGKVVGGPPLADDASQVLAMQENSQPIPLANPIVAEQISASNTEEFDVLTPAAQQPIFTPKPVMPAMASTLPGGYYVQAGAFSNPENAARLQKQLHRFGNVVISERQTASGTFYRVRVGPFADADSAVSVMDTMGSAGYDDTRLIQELQ